ncbi:C6 sexual development transcription factor-like protein NosA [Plenodomus tracheiphilus IPT5]|uniref:C6 sexual development transcription factor-like protein NosA n=1 Tax=Plenodomus tracheiphilus IPT5 TaxID=1408161 RepID=A0A6A7BHG1_9PLEO|nr:C6 sexual development transcription factor-like protein NosA [Plenodomus tracheiphilus IPT5]
MSSSSALTSTTKKSSTMVGTTNAANAARAAAAKMHRRSRTGCFTCRLRRKKCDEGKSACRACKHLGLKCEYKRPTWWSNNEQRRNQKELIKNIIKRTKLNEKTAQGVPMVSNTPPSLCHSMQTADTFSDGIACTRAPSVDSQNSLDYPFQADATPDFYNASMPPPMFAPSFAHPGHFAPYEIDIKTESQMFINDIPTRRDSTISTYSHYQTPPAVGHIYPTDSWIQQDYFESRRESFAEEPLEYPIFDFPTHGAFSPQHQPSIQVDECDQHLLSHFLDSVMPSIFPVLETNQPGAARGEVIIPALESNKAYLHCCMSVSALQMKTTQGLQGPEIDQDIYRNRYAAVQQLTESLSSDSAHAQTLEATLGMIFFPCSVGRADDGLVDIPWHQHFQAVQSLVHQLELPAQMVAMNGQAHSQPPFNMTLASWIDILGATMLAKTPSFADTYREKLIADASSGLAELMGCEDRIMYLISEIACLEALKNEGMDIVQLCAHIKLLGEQISLTEPPQGSLNSAYSSTGEVLPRQLRRNMTAVYRLAARIYLCSLVPDFDRTSPSFVNLVSALCKAMEYIPAGSEGFDRSLVWPLLVAGSISLPGSSFRSMFAERSALLGDAANYGSYGKVRELLNQVWLVNDDNLAKGSTQSIHWRDMMRQKGWDFLLI